MLSFVLHYGNDPLVLDQPEDDLGTEWISQLVVRQLRTSRWTRQLIIVTHNANIPVNADAERAIVLENAGVGIAVRTSPPVGVGAEAREHCARWRTRWSEPTFSRSWRAASTRSFAESAVTTMS